MIIIINVFLQRHEVVTSGEALNGLGDALKLPLWGGGDPTPSNT